MVSGEALTCRAGNINMQGSDCRSRNHSVESHIRLRSYLPRAGVSSRAEWCGPLGDGH